MAKKPDSIPSRARRATPDEMVTRVSHIVRLMAAEQWDPKMSAGLAEEWGTTVEAVAKLAAEASRYRRMACGDPKEIRQALLDKMAELTVMAQQVGDFKAAIQGCRVLMESQAMLIQKHEHKNAPDKMTDEELTQRLERALEQRRQGAH